jgi:TnsA endonuclease N terminal/TnsA endonuclease C terminal
VNHRSCCDCRAVFDLLGDKSDATPNKRKCDQFSFLQKRVRLVYTRGVTLPARKVPKNYRNVTGLISTTKSDRMTAYESRLEHDFMKLVGFDPRVSSYVEQPVKIEFTDATGRLRTYTPDILVSYHPQQDAQDTRPLLVEIKYRRDLFKNWPDLKPKFRAARRYAREQGWEFKIITEVEIRTPYLKNVVFLLGYRNLSVVDAETGQLLEMLKRLGGADPDELLLAISEGRIKRAQLLPTLWHLVANNCIGVDLTQPLTMRSRLWTTP